MKKKLELKKKVVSTLSDTEKKLIVGGNAATTSYVECTGWLCCTPYTTVPYETTTVVECTLLNSNTCQSTTITGC